MENITVKQEEQEQVQRYQKCRRCFVNCLIDQFRFKIKSGTFVKTCNQCLAFERAYSRARKEKKRLEGQTTDQENQIVPPGIE